MWNIHCFHAVLFSALIYKKWQCITVCCIEYSGLLAAWSWGLYQQSSNRINTQIHSTCLVWLISGGGGLDLHCLTENMTALNHFMYSHLIPADRRGLKISKPMNILQQHTLFYDACSLFFSLILPVFASFPVHGDKKDGKAHNLTKQTCMTLLFFSLKWLPSGFVWKDIDSVPIFSMQTHPFFHNGATQSIMSNSIHYEVCSAFLSSLSSQMHIRAEVDEVVLSDH